MPKFIYVYILRSQIRPDTYCTGVRFLPWTPFCHLAAIALLELFLKFEYQRRVAAGHPFRDEAAEVLRLGPLIQQSISHKLGQRAELLVSQSDWGDQQRVEALEDWINWAAEDYQIGSDAGIEGIIVAS